MSTYIERDRRVSSKLRVTGSVALAGICLLLSPLWSGGAWGQQTRTELVPRTELRKHPKGFAGQPIPVEPAAAAAPTVTPVALPVTNPASALGSALAACDKGGEGSEPLTLPGARGEIKLDRCYRGRDHLVCSFNALLTEGKSLLENYKKIVDANYPNVNGIDGICSIKPDNLTSDLQSATDFAARFRGLKAEYEARANCAIRVQQSFRDVTLPDMAQAPSILKSMIESIEGDMKGVSGLQAQVMQLAEKIDASQKSMNTIQKIHRTMCVRHQRAVTDAENRQAR